MSMTIITGTTMTMRTDPTHDAALYRLMTWLSPSYPVGAYTYSHGLEQAVETGRMTNRASLEAWVGDILLHGDGLTDAVMLKAAYETVGDGTALAAINDLALAYAPTAELALESENQGAAFVEMTAKAWPDAKLHMLTGAHAGPYPYAVAVGVAAANAGVPLTNTLHAFLHAFAANMISAAVRLIPLGQTDGQLATAGLEAAVTLVTEKALTLTPDDIGTSTLRADIASMKHETQYTRLFRS